MSDGGNKCKMRSEVNSLIYGCSPAAPACTAMPIMWPAVCSRNSLPTLVSWLRMSATADTLHRQQSSTEWPQAPCMPCCDESDGAQLCLFNGVASHMEWPCNVTQHYRLPSSPFHSRPTIHFVFLSLSEGVFSSLPLVNVALCSFPEQY